jgi:tRNA threonylcarbamoyladenosine biosynthesis protein TsaB
MIVLALDSASRHCSAAVCDAQGVRAEAGDASSETHARHLMVLVDRVLQRAGLAMGQIDGIAVCRGPGSFTGVRIAMATAKGLAAASGLPLVGVSSLAALAWPLSDFPGWICPMLDARRQEVYFARYRAANGRLETVIEAQAGSPEKAAAGIDGPALFVGEGAQAYAARLQAAVGGNWRLAEERRHVIRAAHVAALAREALRAGQDESLRLAPLYLRPSYAKPP